MRTIAFLLLANSALTAGDLRVTTPNDGYGIVVVESMDEDQDIKNPEASIQQEAQIAVHEFRNLKSGKYRVSYMSGLDPLAFLRTIMETHIEVHEKGKESVILFQSWKQGGPTLPKDVEEFLMNHRGNYLTLEVIYKGCKESFELTRGQFSDICSLRSDGNYHLKVWNHPDKEFPKERKVIFEKTFQAVPASTDPFFLDADPRKTDKKDQAPSDEDKMPE